MTENIQHILKENKRRKDELTAPYDPVTGIGSPIEREKVTIDDNTDWWLPLEMLNEPIVLAIKKYGSLIKLANVLDVSYEELQDELIKVRFKKDFEFWAYVCHPIQDAESGEVNQFKFRRAQRKVWGVIHGQIMRDEPIRVIVGKARQWGGSTFANALHRWIQIEVKENWHSAICADVEDQAKNIRGMSDLMYKTYPYGSFTLRPYQGSSKNKIVTERGCIVGVGSMEKPDNLRSFNFKMLHLTEVGLWKKTAGKSPQDLAQSLRSQVKKVPWSVIILESTAKGVGNFFHEEWKNAINKKSGYEPVFVPWWEIEMYQKPLSVSPEEFYQSLTNNSDEYGMFLWNLGATLEGINWYFNFKESENYDDWRMMSEFPSTWQEMFQSSGRRAFPPAYVQRARKCNCKPLFVGEMTADALFGKEALQNVDFQPQPKGHFWIWAMPDRSIKVSNRYCVSVDIGGRSVGSDYSVIRVFDRFAMIEGGMPEAIATWRGHCFVPETLIYTSVGFKEIKDVKIGDLVWTHKNRFKKVIRTYKNEYQGEVISIKSQGNYEIVSCTPDHPFYSNNLIDIIEKKPWKGNKFQYHRKKHIGNPSWVKANDLQYISYSREREDNGNLKFLINKYNGGRSKDTQREITDLKTFYSILGYYLAEGHINKRPYDNKPASICFSFSYDESCTIAKDCYEKILKLGFKASIIEYKSVGVCRVRAYDTNLATLILELCGEHSWNKIISQNILASDKDLLSELMDSYWKGDGSVYSTDQSVSNTISTVSPILARQVRDILILLGHRPGIYRVIAKTRGKNIKSQRPRYNVVWSASEIKKNSLLQDENNLVYKIKTKTSQQYSGFVYNLEVEEDNSYSTACYIVHNCDQDLVCWKAAQIAKFYNNALLIPESNSIAEETSDSEGDQLMLILDQIVKYYDNIFCRTNPEKIRQGIPAVYGFQTNRKTKPSIISLLNKALRTTGYVEYDARVCDEYDEYEIKPNGTYGNVDGKNKHDDLVMSTAIGVWCCLSYMEPPTLIVENEFKRRQKVVSEASF